MYILIKLKLLLVCISPLMSDEYKSPYIVKQMGLFKHVWPFCTDQVLKGYNILNCRIFI